MCKQLKEKKERHRILLKQQNLANVYSSKCGLSTDEIPVFTGKTDFWMKKNTPIRGILFHAVSI